MIQHGKNVKFTINHIFVGGWRMCRYCWSRRLRCLGIRCAIRFASTAEYSGGCQFIFAAELPWFYWFWFAANCSRCEYSSRISKVLTQKNVWMKHSLASRIATMSTAAHSAKPTIHIIRLRQFDLRRLSLVTYNFSPLKIKDVPVKMRSWNGHSSEIDWFVVNQAEWFF